MNKLHPKQHLVVLIALTPFLLAFSVAILVAGLPGDPPRQLAPGEGLAFIGLALSCGVGLLTWLGLRAVDRQRVFRRLSLLGTVLAVFVGAPAWTLGVLPTVNGLHLGAPVMTPMAVAKGQTLPKASAYSFVHLLPLPLDRELPAGRYIWSTPPEVLPAGVVVTHAKGLLGARVVLAIRPIEGDKLASK